MMNSLSRICVRRAASAAVVTTTAARQQQQQLVRRAWLSSGSVTYSGGQASEGQGGYYGSGGSRVIGADDVDTEGRNRVIAMAADVQRIQMTVTELDVLENLLRSEEEDAMGAAGSDASGKSSPPVTSKTIELKNSIKKLITSTDVVESLKNLEIQGSPVWGLSTEEREMIVYLRDKMNES